MFRKVKGAYVVLGMNGNSQLYLEFDEPWDFPKMPERQPGSYLTIDPNGMVSYGSFDENLKWWSSSAGIINKIFDVEIFDCTVIERGPDGTPAHHTGAITKTFAEHILKEFALPFHLVQALTAYGTRWDLWQDDDNVGSMVTVKSVFTDEMLTTPIIKRVRQAITDNEGFVIDAGTENGRVMYLGYKDIPEIYKGLTWDQYYRIIQGG